MQQSQGKLADGRRRGGGSFVTLLFVAAVPLAAAVFALTQALIAPSDEVAAFVPGNAVAYLHAGGRTAANVVLSSSVQMPSGISPDEVAVFATPGDDTLRWGVLVGWRRPRTPSAEERAALAIRGAEPLDARRYLIGDSSLAVATRVAAAAHSSIADDGKKWRALALMRSIAAIQVYAEPAALLPPEASAMIADISADAASPIVAAVNLSSGAIHVRALSLEAAASHYSVLGYRESSVRRTRADLGRFPAGVAMAEAAPSFDIGKLLAEIPHADDHPAPSLLSEAGDELRSSLALPYMLWLRPEIPDGRIGYLLRFPGADTRRVKRALARYAAAINPDRTVLRLPDGAAVTEFRLDVASREAGMSSKDDTVALGDGPENAIVVGSDGAGGSLIASSEGMMAEYRATKPSNFRDENGCPAANSPSQIEVRDPAAILAPISQAESAIKALGVKTIIIGTSVDKEFLVCGYK